MRFTNLFAVVLILLLIMGFTFHYTNLSVQINIKKIAGGLLGPVAMGYAKDGSGRLFICEQTGKIKVIKNGKVLSKPFLDVGNKIDKGSKFYSEKGLLGIAFHPKYKTNGRFFIFYSAPSKVSGSNHKCIVAAYKVTSDADVADATSEKIIMEIEKPQENHNGGQLAFGPDGYLYIGLGDGGGANDEHGAIGNGQEKNTLLGKILRINIDFAAINKDSKNYNIPSDNPFLTTKNTRPEIWAYGLRNPWRFSFDRKTGKLFCADVGQNTWEEIDIIEQGKNYGWRIMEGKHCFNPKNNCDQKGLTLPVAEYDHQTGISVTGGYIYRGNKIQYMQGKYIFGDWKGKLFYLEENAGVWNMNKLLITGKEQNDLDANINSFGEDESGEVYILSQKFTGTVVTNGSLYLITAK